MIRPMMMLMSLLVVVANGGEIYFRFAGVTSRIPEQHLYVGVGDKYYPVAGVASNTPADRATYVCVLDQEIATDAKLSVLLLEPASVTFVNDDSAVLEPYLYKDLVKPEKQQAWTVQPLEHPNRLYFVRQDARSSSLPDPYQKVLYFMADEFLDMYALGPESTAAASAMIRRETKINMARLLIEKNADPKNRLNLYDGPWPSTCVVVGDYAARAAHFWHAGFWGRRNTPICVPLHGYQQYRDLIIGGTGGLIGVPALPENRPTMKSVPAPRTAGPQPGQTMTVDVGRGVKLDLVWVPPGEAMTGSPNNDLDRLDNETMQRVTFAEGYWIGKYEVTQAQYTAVMGTNPSHFGGADLPVEKVGWDDALEFCRKIGVRLPTEREWEYACRAGTTTRYSFGDSIAPSEANFRPRQGSQPGQYRAKPTPVGSYPANAWGLYDMHGNVAEWCADAYDHTAGDEQAGPRVIRGGNWILEPSCLRSAARSIAPRNARFVGFGFRVVKDP